MAEEDTGQEKTLEPTPQRLEKARRQGDVPKSTDVATAASYLALLIALIASGGAVALGFAGPLSLFLSNPEAMVGRLLGPGGMAFAGEILGAALLAMAPIFLAPAVGVVIALVAQRAVVLAPEKILPKLSRISPIANAANKFGPTGLMEFLKSTVKLVAIGALLITLMLSQGDALAALMLYDAKALPQLLYDHGLALLGACVALVGAIGALDLAWQNYDHRRKLRMSQQEVKEETKDLEGDPHLKNVRRQRGREIAANRQLEEVPKADVVIVNPTHYAVALKWARMPGTAPECVAKGTDEIAARIRERAEEHDVPVHSDPPTARALYASVELGEEIKPEHYQAVGAAIVFADKMRAKRAERLAASWRRPPPTDEDA